MRKVLSVVALSTTIALAACGSAGTYEPTDERPATAKTVARKYIDPAHYKNGECLRRVSGRCKQYKRVLTDDKDWVLVTSDGVHYDVSESEYNRVKIGDSWR